MSTFNNIETYESLIQIEIHSLNEELQSCLGDRLEIRKSGKSLQNLEADLDRKIAEIEKKIFWSKLAQSLMRAALDDIKKRTNTSLESHLLETIIACLRSGMEEIADSLNSLLDNLKSEFQVIANLKAESQAKTVNPQPMPRQRQNGLDISSWR